METSGWTRFDAPHLAFSHPPSWEVSEDGALQLVSPAGSAFTFSVMTTPVDAGDDVQRNEQSLGGAMPGRSWVLSRRTVMVMVTYFASEKALAKERDIVDEIIGSAVPAPDVPEDGKALAEELARRIRERFPRAVVMVTGLEVDVAERGTFNVDNLMRACRANPAEREERMQQFLETLTAMDRMQALLVSWDSARDHVFPLLIPEGHIEPGRVRRALGAGLSIVYSVDAGPAMARLTEEMAKDWGVDPIAVHERALHNLSEKYEVELGAREGERIDVGELARFTFATGQVLLPAFEEVALERFGGAFLFAMPSRDVVLVARKTDKEALRQLAKIDHAELPFALTEDIYSFDRGRISLVPKGSWVSRLLGR